MKVSSGTIARTIILVLALINQILVATGRSVIPIEDDTVVQVVSLLATVVTSLIAWWKNNSFTQAALAGDIAKEEYKAEHLGDGVN